MCGVFFEGAGDWVGGKRGGTRSRCFNSGYHDLGLLQVLFYVHMSSGLLFLC
jgi:hypothetical protein